MSQPMIFGPCICFSFMFLFLVFSGCRYIPLFDYFMELQATAFRVIADNYVTDDSGTGVVHCAPAFSEDDHRVCLAAGIIEVEIPLFTI